MLAAAGDYFQPWQLPLILLVIVAWLVGGGFLFQKILGRRVDRRRYSLGRGMLVSLLSGGGGGFAALALYFIGKTILPVEPDPLRPPISWLGVWLGIPGYFVVAYLIVYAMHKLTAADTFKAALVPVVSPFLFGGVVMGTSFYFTAQNVREERKHLQRVGLELQAAMRIYNALERKMLQTGKPAESLEELVQGNYLTAEELKSPVHPEGRGFFYTGARPVKDRESRTVILCSYVENFGDRGRAIIYAGGAYEFLAPEAVQARLDQPENRRFGKALQAAEKK